MPRRLHGVAKRYIVGHHHAVDGNALGTGQLRRQAKVQPVAGVVFDDEQYAFRAGDGADRRQHGVYAGRGEYVAHCGGVQHAVADVAGVGGLVAAAAAGDQRHFVELTVSRKIRAQQDVFLFEQGQAGQGVGQPFQHFPRHMARIVD